jgi:hypothetical protein
MPHRQAPICEQLSATAALHAKQVEPAAPQFAGERTWQLVPWQQPSGQEVASQVQMPPSQRCPSAQAAPVPHEHFPVVALQPSALDVSHAMQTEPSAPHEALVVSVLQVFPLQHPAQVPQLEQAPSSQTSPVGHCAQLAPRVPQKFLSLVPGRHVVPLQQPVLQDVPSQTQAPLTQCWPAPHATFWPQKHPPIVSHVSVFVVSQPVQTHAPPRQVWPG